jgi:hypothetical protein
MLEFIFANVLFCLTWYIITQPGEIGQYIARWVNVNIKSALVRKLILCPYCLSGQIAFWFSIHDLFNCWEWSEMAALFLLRICGSIILTFVGVKFLDSISQR